MDGKTNPLMNQNVVEVLSLSLPLYFVLFPSLCVFFSLSFSLSLSLSLSLFLSLFCYFSLFIEFI